MYFFDIIELVTANGGADIEVCLYSIIVFSVIQKMVLMQSGHILNWLIR